MSRQPKPLYPDHRPPPWHHRRCDPRSLEPIVRREYQKRPTLPSHNQAQQRLSAASWHEPKRAQSALPDFLGVRLRWRRVVLLGVIICRRAWLVRDGAGKDSHPALGFSDRAGLSAVDAVLCNGKGGHGRQESIGPVAGLFSGPLTAGRGAGGDPTAILSTPPLRRLFRESPAIVILPLFPGCFFI
jgi:hypothetical protein